MIQIYQDFESNNYRDTDHRIYIKQLSMLEQYLGNMEYNSNEQIECSWKVELDIDDG